MHGPPITFLANLMQMGTLSLLKQKMERPTRDLSADRHETDRQRKDRQETDGQETDRHKQVVPQVLRFSIPALKPSMLKAEQICPLFFPTGLENSVCLHVDHGSWYAGQHTKGALCGRK